MQDEVIKFAVKGYSSRTFQLSFWLSANVDPVSEW